MLFYKILSLNLVHTYDYEVLDLNAMSMLSILCLIGLMIFLLCLFLNHYPYNFPDTLLNTFAEHIQTITWILLCRWTCINCPSTPRAER